MSNSVKAFVEYIHVSEPKKGRKGGTYQSYNAKLQDPQTGKVLDKWFQFGFEPPANAAGQLMKVGDYIQIQADDVGAAMRVVKDSLKIHPNPPARPENPDAEKDSGKGGGGHGGGGGGGHSGPKFTESEIFGKIGGYYTEDDVRRIAYSTALSTAKDVIISLLEQKSLKVSEAQGAAGVVKRYDQIITAIDKLAVKYFHDIASGRQLTAHEDEGTVLGAQTTTEDLPDAEPAKGDDFEDDYVPTGDFPDEGDDFE